MRRLTSDNLLASHLFGRFWILSKINLKVLVPKLLWKNGTSRYFSKSLTLEKCSFPYIIVAISLDTLWKKNNWVFYLFTLWPKKGHIWSRTCFRQPIPFSLALQKTTRSSTKNRWDTPDPLRDSINDSHIPFSIATSIKWPNHSMPSTKMYERVDLFVTPF